MFAGSITGAPQIPVRFIAGDRTLALPQQALNALEQLQHNLGSILGRKSYDVVPGVEYRACVVIRPDEPTDSIHV